MDFISQKPIYEALLRAKRPCDFFGDVPSASDLKEAYKKLAKKIHPDVVDSGCEYVASEAFALLNGLYHRGLKEFQDGVYGVFDASKLYEQQSPLFEITVKGQLYRFFENVYEGEVSYIFKGLAGDDVVFLKVAIDPDDNVLLDTEFDVLSKCRHQSFPYVIHKFKVNDSNAILMREVGGISMEELLHKYKHGVPSHHVMWMLERLLGSVGYLHSNMVVHGNIKPENITINKENHNVSLTGFSFCIPEANTADAKYKIVNDFYTAPEVSKNARVVPSSDIYSIGKLAIKLLGGDVKTGGIPVRVDIRVRQFIRKMTNPDVTKRSDDAWKLWSELIALRNEVFGTQRFQKLD